MRRLDRLVVLTVAALVALAPSLMEPGAVLARRGQPIILSHQLVLVPSTRRIFVCQDEEASMYIRAHENIVYRNPGDSRTTRRRGTRSPQAAFRLNTTPSDPNVASITPPFQGLNSASSFYGIFTIKGNDVGSSTITFQDTLGEARPVTLTVHTLECAIKVSSTTTWALNFNYPLSAWARMDDATLNRTGPDQYEGQGTLDNFASAASIGGCSARYTVPSVRVKLSAKIVNSSASGVSSQRLKITITYDWVAFSFPVQCLIMPGTGKARGQPGRVEIDVQAFVHRKVVSPQNHLMITERGSFSGDGQFVVSTEDVVPPPPP